MAKKKKKKKAKEEEVVERQNYETFPLLQDTYYAQRLANAIVLQAAKDYRKSYENWDHEKEEKRIEARKFRKEVPEFFLSSWFETLTNLNGEQLLKDLDEEYI